jgi:hypothetical protein
MAKIYFFFLLSFGLLCQTKGQNFFKAPSLDSILATHKSVAILPFNVTIKAKNLNPKRTDVELLTQQQKQLSLAMQSSLYNYILRKVKRTRFNVKFQDLKNTLALLTKAKALPDGMTGFTYSDLLQALQVDALIGADIIIEKKDTYCTIFIIHSDGEVVWRISRDISDGYKDNTDEFIDDLMRKMVSKLPWE